MALVKCPECGAQVSSNAKQCVHCGCKYSVCSECGTVHIGEIDKCPVCGYQIVARKIFTNNKDKNESLGSDFGTDIIAIWQSRSGTDKVVMKAIKWTNIVSSILVIIFALIAFLIIETWDTSALDSLFKMAKIYDYAHGLIIASCVVGALNILINNLKIIYSQVLCSMWLRKNNIDVSPYVKQASGQVKLTDYPQEWDYDNISSAAYLASAPNDKSIRITQFALYFTTTVAATVCLCVFLIQNADQLILCKLTNAEFDFQYIVLIPTVIFIGLYIMTAFISEKIFTKRKTAWIESLGS